MGLTNFDALPENLAMTRLREAQQTAQERKGSAQRVAGSNLRYFRTSNTGEYAWEGQTDFQSPQAPSTGGAFFTITLTSQNAPVFLNDLVVEVFKSNDGGDTYTEVDPFELTTVWTLLPAAPIGITPYEARWLFYLHSTLDDYVAFKLQALTTDVVTITVERDM